jgi:hypothetical protein
MADAIVCVGCPRDQGLDQARACRGPIRDRVARSGIAVRRRRRATLRPFAAGPVLGSGPGRDLIRHYTHLSERLEGIALGADLPLDALVEVGLRCADLLDREAAVVACEEAGGRVARALPESVSPGSRWILRRSRPEVGFASLEVTLPWLSSALVGVNQEGLAAALATGPEGAGFMPGLLVQECLQRFSDVESSLDWCLKRPKAGPGTVVLADGGGDIAAVRVTGGERQLLRPNEGLLVQGGSAELEAELRKVHHQGGCVDPQLLAKRGASVVSIEPAERRLRLGELSLRV